MRHMYNHNAENKDTDIKPLAALEPQHEEEPMPEGEDRAPPGVRTMAIIRWVLVGLMAIAAAASIAYSFGVFQRAGVSDSATQYYCPMHPSVVQDQPGDCPICSMSLVLKEGGAKKQSGAPAAALAHSQKDSGETESSGSAKDGAYYCPMHPEVTSDDPNAKCAECGGMKLMPKPAKGPAGGMVIPAGIQGHEGMEHGAALGQQVAQPDASAVPGLSEVTLTPERIQLMGMKTARVIKEKLVPELRTVGFLTANEERLAQIHTRFSGWIEQLLVSQTGQRVTKGQVLAAVYSPELLTAQQEFLNARKWTRGDGDPSEADRLSEGLAEDARRRLELLGISKREIDELERTGQPKRALEIRSPVEGYVTRKNAFQGIYVQPGTELFEVVDLSSVWVLAEVYEDEMERVHVGAPAQLQLAAYRGQAFRGRVQFIYPTVDTGSRTLRVRLEFKNPGLKLRPGMYGDVVIELPAAEGLVVPADAIVDTGELQYVFLAREGGRFEPRRVKVGAESNGRVEVLEGVSAGDGVVTTANFLIDSESRLQAAISGQLVAEDGAKPVPGSGQGPNCETEFDKQKSPDKYQQCRACEVQHRGMGTMEEDCKNAILKPWL